MHIKIYYRSSDGEIFQNGKHCIIIALILNLVDIFLVSTSVAKAQINSSRVFPKNAHTEKWLYLHFLFCHWQLGMIIFYIIYFFQFTYPGGYTPIMSTFLSLTLRKTRLYKSTTEVNNRYKLRHVSQFSEQTFFWDTQ